MILLSDVTDEPAVYLRQPPTTEEHILSEVLDLHDGANIPFWMFAKVAIRQHRHSLWIGGMEGFFKSVRRHARAGVAALLVNLVAIGGYASHRIAANAAAEEHAANQEHEIQELRLDIRELRVLLRRMSGSEPGQPNSDTGYDPDPDKLAGLGPLVDILAAPLPVPVPKLICGSPCSSSIECSAGILKPCPFCNFGTCKSTRPEQPVPPDAGVDAPSK